MHVP
jgi:hypothetical protein